MKSKPINTDKSRQEITSSIQGFPLTCYFSRFSSSTYDSIDWHWHVEFQLCIVTEGSVLWQIGPAQITVDTGDGIFINSQQVHRVQPHNCSSASFFCVDFRPDILRDMEGDTLYTQYVLPVLSAAGAAAKKISAHERTENDILQQLKSMADIFEKKNTCFEYELIGKAYAIWGKLFPVISQTPSGSDVHDARLKEIFICIQSSYTRPLTLDDIASRAGISRGECCRYFKARTGQTLFEYLVRYRISKSFDLLLTTSKSISQIAQDVGFSSQSYYAERFQRFTGMTPTGYRRAHRLSS